MTPTFVTASRSTWGHGCLAVTRRSGLTPALEAFQRIEGGEHAHVYDYLAETVRSLLPRMIALGVVKEEDVGIDTLAARAKRAAVEGRHCFFYPRMVGAWARKP